MKVELYFTYTGLKEDDLLGKTVVVIDVLRACTVISTAFAAGCREIIPVNSIGAASTLASNLDKDVVILAGEREGHRVDGFDLGNSPLEFTKEVVKDKTVILASTNGTKAIVLGSSGERCLTASLTNISTVSRYLDELNSRTVIICSGKESRFSLEDAICGGMIISKLKSKPEFVNDAVEVAAALASKYEGDVHSALKHCDHGKYLTSIGYAADIEYASRLDELDVLPFWDGGRLVVKN